MSKQTKQPVRMEPTGNGMHALLMRREEVMSRKPDGELGLHVHPDADHTLMVLEGRVRVFYGQDKTAEIGSGDYISIAKSVPHKYATVTPKALLLSFDAPPYDPAKTQSLP